jgi:hypothetical protein
MLKRNFLKISIFLFVILTIPVGLVSAQVQSEEFSGNSPDSYSCYNRQGDLLTKDNAGGDVKPEKSIADGVYYCNMNGIPGYQPCNSGVFDNGANCDALAVLNPPTLQQLQVWFVRIVYAIWAVAAFVSVFGIIAIGYQYMISRGAPEATVKVKDRMSKFILGFALVFLAIPILNTVFRLLGVNDAVNCYQSLTNNDVGIGFQFVFPELCTAPNLVNAVSASEVCSEASRIGVNLSNDSSTGLACAPDGDVSPTCNPAPGYSITFVCKDNIWVTRIVN